MLFLKIIFCIFISMKIVEETGSGKEFSSQQERPGFLSLSLTLVVVFFSIFWVAKQCKYAKCDWDKEKPLVVDKKSQRRKSDAEEGHCKFTRGCD